MEIFRKTPSFKHDRTLLARWNNCSANPQDLRKSPIWLKVPAEGLARQGVLPALKLIGCGIDSLDVQTMQTVGLLARWMRYLVSVQLQVH